MVTINEKLFNEFLEAPFFSKMVAGSGYKSVGVRIVEDGKVLQELTSSYSKKRAIIKKGIQNPDFIISVNHKFLKSLDDKKLRWIKDNPLKAYFRYHNEVDMPFFVKLRILGMLQDA